MNFDAIGTHWVIDVYDGVISPELERKIMERIEAFDRAYSRFRDDSLVTTMSQTAGEYVLPDDAYEMFSLYRKMYDITNGQFTPLIGQALVDAGYDAKYSLVQQKDLITPPKWDDVLEFLHEGDTSKLIIKKPVLLDFGAAGKGYLIDIIAGVLDDNGVHSYCLEAGGDIIHRSQKNNIAGEAITVGLEHPDDTSQAIGTILLLNKSLCGSAGNRRAWGNFHHIINPTTLSSPRHIKALWVIADTTILADALTTALYFVRPETLRTKFHFEYLIVNDDYSFNKSEGFAAEMFI